MGPRAGLDGGVHSESHKDDDYDDDDDDNNNNNNNNNNCVIIEIQYMWNVKAKVIPVKIRETGAIKNHVDFT